MKILRPKMDFSLAFPLNLPDPSWGGRKEGAASPPRLLPPLFALSSGLPKGAKPASPGEGRKKAPWLPPPPFVRVRRGSSAKDGKAAEEEEGPFAPASSAFLSRTTGGGEALSPPSLKGAPNHLKEGPSLLRPELVAPDDSLSLSLLQLLLFPLPRSLARRTQRRNGFLSAVLP